MMRWYSEVRVDGKGAGTAVTADASEETKYFQAKGKGR
jgi:hypothetical protein